MILAVQMLPLAALLLGAVDGLHLSRAETWSGHDALGQLTSIDAPGVPGRTFDHDHLGRETSRTRGGSRWATSWSSGKETTTQQYNGLDGLMQATESGVDGGVGTTYVHDEPRRLLTSIQRDGAPVLYRYDAWGSFRGTPPRRACSGWRSGPGWFRS